MKTNFKSTLYQPEGKNTTGIRVPEANIQELGAGKKPPVNVTVNGYTYKSTVAVMGGEYLISFASEHRAASGIKAGDPIDVTLELDTAPRTVDVPEALAAALDAAGVRVKFDALAPSARKAHVTQVNDAKSEETRQRRIEKIVGQLA